MSGRGAIPVVNSARTVRNVCAALLAGFVGLSVLSAGQADAEEPGQSMLIGNITSQPIGHYEFCRRNFAECDVRSTTSPAPRVTDYGWDVIREVNSAVNLSIVPRTDIEMHGVEELWSYPELEGDCEDYVLLKRLMLMERGFRGARPADHRRPQTGWRGPCRADAADFGRGLHSRQSVGDGEPLDRHALQLSEAAGLVPFRPLGVDRKPRGHPRRRPRLTARPLQNGNGSQLKKKAHSLREPIERFHCWSALSVECETMADEREDRIEIDNGMERLVLTQIQTAPNRRILSSMPPFKLETELPDGMMDLLRQLQAAEHSTPNRQRRAG
jgi:hypothetical protein